MESHYVHAFARGPVQQAAPCEDRLRGSVIEAVVPFGVLQMQWMRGGVAQIEKLLSIRGDADCEVSGCVAEGRNGG